MVGTFMVSYPQTRAGRRPLSSASFKSNLIAQPAGRWYVLLSHWIEGLRAIRHSNGTETRLTGTGRQSRARPSSRKAPSAGRQDLAGRLRPLQVAMRRRLTRADAFTEILRAVNASLEPERVADAMIARPCGLDSGVRLAGRWPPTRVEPRRIAAPGLPPALEPVGPGGGRVRARWGGRVLLGRCVGRSASARDRQPAARRPLSACRSSAAAGWWARWSAIDRAPSAREPRFAASSLSVLRAVLEPGALALDNALRIERAEALSVTDDLTQLYNSRYLSQVLRRETKRASRSGRPLSLLFIDLDGFKGVNDTPRPSGGERARWSKRPR